RLDSFVGLACESIAKETGRSFDRWGFIHGLWALNASDPSACMVEDEIQLLMRHGCFGDFTFPAGRGHCNPTVCDRPYTCLPLRGVKTYDLPEADPQPLVEGGRQLTSDRFFLWNTAVASRLSSLDTYWEPNLAEFKQPERLVGGWFEKGVVLDRALYIKTHSHSLAESYGIKRGEGLSPH